jgi:hypothetical protein
MVVHVAAPGRALAAKLGVLVARAPAICRLLATPRVRDLEGQQRSRGLGDALLILEVGLAVRDDPAAGLHGGDAVA